MNTATAYYKLVEGGFSLNEDKTYNYEFLVGGGVFESSESDDGFEGDDDLNNLLGYLDDLKEEDSEEDPERKTAKKSKKREKSKDVMGGDESSSEDSSEEDDLMNIINEALDENSDDEEDAPSKKKDKNNPKSKLEGGVVDHLSELFNSDVDFKKDGNALAGIITSVFDGGDDISLV